MALLSEMNKHVIKYRMLYFGASVILLILVLIFKWVGSFPPDTATVTFTINGNASVSLHLKELTRESTEEFIVSGIRRFERQIQIGSEVRIKWYTLDPGRKVVVAIGEGLHLQTLEQDRGEWIFTLEPGGAGCFISALSV